MTEVEGKSTDVSLTTDNILRELHGVNLHRLGSVLRVPDHKRAEIKQQHSTQTSRMKAIIEYWLSVAPAPSWRKLLFTLEYCGLCQAEDKVKPHVEPLIDPSLTIENVSSVLESVKGWQRLCLVLIVPAFRKNLIKKTYSTDSQLRQATVDWWLQSSPAASWTSLAGELYQHKERASLELASKYIQKHIADSTLTVTNLMTALMPVRNVHWWGDRGLCRFLRVPESAVNEIQQQSSDVTQQKMMLLERWLRDHPAPSWVVVAEALFWLGEHGVLEEVKKAYITGVKSLVRCCLSVVVESEQLMAQLPSLPYILQNQIKGSTSSRLHN